MQNLIWIIAVCSVGTFAMRFLPMWWRHTHQDQAIPKVLERGLAALGYSAIVALVVVSASPQVVGAQPLFALLRMIIAIFAIGLTHYLQKSVILSTLTGVLVFGFLQYFSVTS